jgi:CheY-like chemotaxis protein
MDYLRRTGQHAASRRPDLVYLDIEMPGMDGQEVLRRIKSDPALRDIPVVMLTGVDDQSQRQRAIRGGASGYVVKPAEPRRFLQAVSASVSRWVRLHEEAAGGQAALTTRLEAFDND